MLRGYLGSSTFALGLKIVPPILNDVFDGEETEKLNDDDDDGVEGASFVFGSLSIFGSVRFSFSFSALISISSSFFTGVVSLDISLVVVVVVMVMLDTDSDDDPDAPLGDGCC